MDDKIIKEKKYMEQIGKEIPLSWYETMPHKETEGFRLIRTLDFNNKLVLDLGAWSGWLGREAYIRGANVILLDIFTICFRKMVHEIEKRNNFIIGMEGNKENISFIDETFDYVITANTLHHGDLEKTVEEIYRVLKKGGIFISTVEPMIPVSYDEDEYLKTNEPCVREIEKGCDERRPNFQKYKNAFEKTFGAVEIYVNSQFVEANDNTYSGVMIRAKKVY